MRPLKEGERVRFVAINNFTGEEYEATGIVICEGVEGKKRGIVDPEEYGEIGEGDFYVVKATGIVICEGVEGKKRGIVDPEEYGEIGEGDFYVVKGSGYSNILYLVADYDILEVMSPEEVTND